MRIDRLVPIPLIGKDNLAREKKILVTEERRRMSMALFPNGKLIATEPGKGKITLILLDETAPN